MAVAYDMQAAQSVAGGYFGGYSAKMQDIGVKEVKRLREASDRKMQSDGPMGLNKKFALYSKRLVKDLEGKGPPK